MKQSEKTRYRVRKLKKAYNIDSVAGIEILENIGKTWEILNEAENELETYRKKHKKVTVLDRFKQEKPHPCISIIKDCQCQVISHLKALGIGLNHSDENLEEDLLARL